MSKKTYMAAIIISALLVSLVGMQCVEMARANDPNTITVPDDYSTIQEAINSAKAGDTVLVRKGTYNETVLMDKSLVLRGLDFPLINPHQRGSPITINAANCIVDGFEVTNSSRSSSEAGIKVQYNSGGNNTIINNIAYNNSLNGIYLRKTSRNSVVNNIVFSNSRGIECSVETDDYLANNTIYSNKDIGILVDASGRIAVINNTVYSNGEDGIMLDGSDDAYIAKNNVFNNPAGINIDYSAHTNLITENNVTGNAWGIRWASMIGTNFLFHNNIIDNAIQALWYDKPTSPTAENYWNGTYPSAGNYWSDYNGSDVDRNGIGDSPYIIDANNIDNFPLMSPYKTSENTENNLQTVDFTNTFHNSKGEPLYAYPSSFKLTFPNRTTSPSLPVGTYQIQTGTTILHSIMWQGTDVSPETPLVFNSAGSSPTARCKVYQLNVIPEFYNVTQNQTIQPSSWSLWLPNGTIVTASGTTTYNQTQYGNYQIRSVLLEGEKSVDVFSSIYLTSDTTWTPRIGIFESVNNATFGFETNSTLTNTDFNPNNRTLSFLVSGPNGTNGYTQIAFTGNLVTDTNDVVVTEDGNPIKYSLTSSGGLWLLAVNYTHSVHSFAVDFGNANVIPELPFCIILPFAAAITLSSFFYQKKKESSQVHRQKQK